MKLPPVKLPLSFCPMELWKSSQESGKSLPRPPALGTSRVSEGVCLRGSNESNKSLKSDFRAEIKEKGQTKWDKPVSAKICGFLRFPAKICGFLRTSAVSCGFLRTSAPPKCYNSQEKRKSAKISENLRKTADSARFVPFSLSLSIPLDLRLLSYCFFKLWVHSSGLLGPEVWTFFRTLPGLLGPSGDPCGGGGEDCKLQI